MNTTHLSTDAPLTEKIIKELIAANEGTYKNDPYRIISDYQNEKEATAAYNGRQLLELLQNADDAGSPSVLIDLNTETNTLRICNNGSAFHAAGLRSLMLANLSPKNKKEFIGNKGLGFRSVLNWVDKVSVILPDYVLDFSPEIARHEFEKLVPNTAHRQQLLAGQKNLLTGEIPMAILAVPDFRQNTGSRQWQTIVELVYKKSEEKNIVNQLDKVKSELLLFLNHITTIQIKISGKPDKKLQRTPTPTSGEVMEIDGVSWQMHDSGEQATADGDKNFRYKIAWRTGLPDKNTTFSTYFPTLIPTLLPCHIHATFDLDPARNYLVQSEDNKTILAKIADCLAKLAETRLKRKRAGWEPMRFLLPLTNSQSGQLQDFYKLLENHRISLSIYPTVTEEYKTLAEVKFYGNELSLWIKRNNLQTYFTDLLLPIEDGVVINKSLCGSYTKAEWHEKLKNISSHISLVKERAALIALITGDDFSVLHGEKLPLLLNHKDEVVQKDVEVYTLQSGSIDDYQIPDYVKLDFISEDLYKALNAQFAAEIEKRGSPNEHPSRTLKKILDPVVNIGSNDVTDIIRNISRAFEQRIENTAVNASDEIKIYVKCLFNIFQKRPDRRGVLTVEIPLYNRNHEKRYATDLFLGSGFTAGSINLVLFEGIYNDTDYVAGNDFWQLDTDTIDENQLQDFFIWLGVNKHTKFKKEEKTLKPGIKDSYAAFVFEQKGWIGDKKPPSTGKYEVTKVQNLDRIIQVFTAPKLVAWIIKDTELRNLLDDSNPSQIVEYTIDKKGNQLTSKPSYFRWQIRETKLLENVFVNFEFASELQLTCVDPKDTLFVQLGIPEADVISTLQSLGAKMSFDELAIEKVYILLENAPKEAVRTRKLYQLAFNYFRNSGIADFSSYAKQAHLYASRGGIRERVNTEEVYYSDNTTLPSQITAEHYIFDFPKRSGERQVAAYFGIKTIKDLNIAICEPVELHPLNDSFNHWLDTIKPYLLTYRFGDKSTETIDKTAASQIKNIRVKLVTELQYTINTGTPKLLLENEFINKNGHEFYICARIAANLCQLKETPALCEAFAEMTCVLFDVNKCKDDFRNVFKDKADLKDTKYLIEAKSLGETYVQAYKLLGLSTSELQFWKAVFDITGTGWKDDLNTAQQLKEFLLDTFHYEMPSYTGKVNFEQFDTEEAVWLLQDLFKCKNISASTIKKRLPTFKGLGQWHLLKYSQYAETLETLWGKAWYLYLESKGEKEQRTFESKRRRYRPLVTSFVEKLAEQEAFILQIDYRLSLLTALAPETKIALDDPSLDSVVIELKYPNLIKDTGIAATDLTDEWRSLLFFTGREAVLKAELERLRALLPGVNSLPDVNEDTSDVIITATSLKKVVVPFTTGKGTIGGSGRTHNEKTSRQNKQSGKRAEKLVRDKLVADYPDGEVYWVSGNSDESKLPLDDSRGYDIRYKVNKADIDWIYLEVKSISGNSFIITANEVEVGITKPDLYHLALVRNKEIFMVSDFFKDRDRVEEFNTFRRAGSIVPLDYEVYFEDLE